METYSLVEGTEINCTVILDSSGIMDVFPTDDNLPYGFVFTETYPDGSLDYKVWASNKENDINDTPFDFSDRLDTIYESENLLVEKYREVVPEYSVSTPPDSNLLPGDNLKL